MAKRRLDARAVTWPIERRPEVWCFDVALAERHARCAVRCSSRYVGSNIGGAFVTFGPVGIMIRP